LFRRSRSNIPEGGLKRGEVVGGDIRETIHRKVIKFRSLNVDGLSGPKKR